MNVKAVCVKCFLFHLFQALLLAYACRDAKASKHIMKRRSPSSPSVEGNELLPADALAMPFPHRFYELYNQIFVNKIRSFSVLAVKMFQEGVNLAQTEVIIAVYIKFVEEFVEESPLLFLLSVYGGIRSL